MLLWKIRGYFTIIMSQQTLVGIASHQSCDLLPPNQSLSPRLFILYPTPLDAVTASRWSAKAWHQDAHVVITFTWPLLSLTETLQPDLTCTTQDGGCNA
jgi:hypothetical protein